jgi:hypothetical protein
VKICLFCTPQLMVATPAVAAPNGGSVRATVQPVGNAP